MSSHGGRGVPFTGVEGLGDFFGPFYRVRFLTPNTNQLDFYDDQGTLVGSSEPGTEAAEILSSVGESEFRFAESGAVGQLRSFVTSLEVLNKGEGASFATLILEPTYLDALSIIDNRLIQYKSIMIIEFGYLGQGSVGDQITSEPHYYVMNKPELSISNLDVSITITGTEIRAFSSTQRTSFRSWDRNFFEYKTDLGILQALVRPMGLRVDTSLTNEPVTDNEAFLSTLGFGESSPVSGVLAAEPPSKSVTGIHVERPVDGESPVLEQNEKDWVFFNQICASNNCSFFTRGDTVHIADWNVVKVRGPAYRLLLFQQLQDDRDIPILSFNGNALPTLFAPAESKETIANSVNMDTNKLDSNVTDPAVADNFKYMGRKTIAGKALSEGASIPVSKKKALKPDPPLDDNQTGRTFSVPDRLPNKKEVTTQPARDATLIANQNATVTIPGVPHITPFMIVELRGCGKVFEGPFIVMEVKHRLDTSGYETELTLMRDTSTADVEVGIGTQPPSTNVQKIDTKGGESVVGSRDQTT